MKHLLLIFFLIYFSYTDLRTRKISNKGICILLGIGTIFLPFSNQSSNYILGLFLPSFLLFGLKVLSSSFIGAGDIKLLMCTGLFLGFRINLILFILACMLSLIYCICHMILRKKNTLTIPFAPFISFSYFILLFCIFL